MHLGRLGLVLVTAGVLLAACTSGSPPAGHPSVPTFAATTTAAVPEISAVPKDCTTVAQEADVDTVVGHQLTGSMAPVVGVAMPSIKRTARLDCYYGIPAGQPPNTAAVSIGIASYADAPTAAQRVQLTVDAARNGGAQASNLKVGADPATLLTETKAQEIVLAHGVLTVLVTALTGVLPAGKASPDLVTLAQRALTAH